MTRNEQQMYSDITSIRKSLEKIANVLEHMNHDSYLAKQEIPKFQDIPGFEGTLDALDNLCNVSTKDEEYDFDVHNDYLNDLVQGMNQIEYLNFHNEMSFSFAYQPSSTRKAILEQQALNRKIAEKEGKYKDGVKNDSDYRIRLVASNYEDDYATKKDAILDYVESEFGADGARYTDVIKFAYYLGAPNAPKYTSENRGYYSCAFSSRMNGHLIQGGRDFLVKGINKNGKERYFTHSSVDKFTDYYKRID